MSKVPSCLCGKCKKCLHRNWRKIKEAKEVAERRHNEIMLSLADHGALTPMSTLNPHIRYSMGSFKFEPTQYFSPGFKRYGHPKRDID